MLKRLLMPLMLILLLPQFMRAQDVAVYPIDVNAIITPPHGTCLKDYVGSRRFMVNVLLRDMTKRPDDFVVEMSVKNAGGRVVFRSYFGNLSLHPGKPAYLDSEIQNGFISQLFNENNISIGRGYATKCFEEGAYTISFQAFSAYHYPQRRIALSRASATTLFMQSTVQGPYLIYPYNKDSIACSETVINFQWQSANPTGEPLSYQLQVAEVPEGVSANRAFEQNSVLVEDVQNLYHSIYQSVKTEGKYKENTTYAWRVLVNKLSGESHISPVYTFVYCGTPQVPEPEIPYDPVLSSKRMDYSLDSLHIDSVDTVSITPLAYWKNKPEIAGKGYCGIGIEVRKQGQDKWTPYIINTVDTTKFQLSNLSYGTLYEIRGQYIKCGEQDTLYGPYGDTLQFIIPDPNRAADCGDDIPPLTDCGDSKGKIMRVGDTINANGTSVIIDSLSYDEKDSTIITGKGHIEFPIIKNIRLWTKFEKIQINCAGELAKGNIVSIYDPRTAAMIDLEELTGENSTGGGDNPVANSTTEAYSKEKFDAAPAGSFFTKGDTVVMKDGSGNEVIIGREISLSSDEYTSRNALADDAHFLEFRNDIDPDNVAFDNDKDNIYSRIDQGKEGYQKFSNSGGRNYIIPWLANNPGKLKPLSVKDINLKGGSLFDSVKFVMPTNGKYIELSCETTGEGEYKIRIPGGAGTRNSFEVYALGKMKGNSSYQDAGKLLIVNYAPRTQKVIIVPVLKEYAVSPDMEQQLNQIYGRLGVSYEVVVDKVFTEIDTVLIDSLKNGLKIGADDESRWQVETQEMKRLRYCYQLAKGDALDKNAAYIFLVEKAEEPYVGVEGDMPRNQSVGYIFMNGKESLADGRLVAHELGHGVYKLQHTFAYKQLAETKGKTDNLMDYNGGSFLAHYQWRVMQDSVMFVWKSLQEDEDGMAKGITGVVASCVGKSFVRVLLNNADDALFAWFLDAFFTGDTDRNRSMQLDLDCSMFVDFASDWIDDFVENKDCFSNGGVEKKAEAIATAFGVIGLVVDAVECYPNSSTESQVNSCLCQVFANFIGGELFSFFDGILDEIGELTDKADKTQKMLKRIKDLKNGVDNFLKKHKIAENFADYTGEQIGEIKDRFLESFCDAVYDNTTKVDPEDEKESFEVTKDGNKFKIKVVTKNEGLKKIMCTTYDKDNRVLEIKDLLSNLKCLSSLNTHQENDRIYVSLYQANSTQEELLSALDKVDKYVNRFGERCDKVEPFCPTLSECVVNNWLTHGLATFEGAWNDKQSNVDHTTGRTYNSSGMVIYKYELEVPCPQNQVCRYDLNFECLIEDENKLPKLKKEKRVIICTGDNVEISEEPQSRPKTQPKGDGCNCNNNKGNEGYIQYPFGHRNSCSEEDSPRKMYESKLGIPKCAGLKKTGEQEGKVVYSISPKTKCGNRIDDLYTVECDGNMSLTGAIDGGVVLLKTNLKALKSEHKYQILEFWDGHCEVVLPTDSKETSFKLVDVQKVNSGDEFLKAFVYLYADWIARCYGKQLLTELSRESELNEMYNAHDNLMKPILNQLCPVDNRDKYKIHSGTYRDDGLIPRAVDRLPSELKMKINKNISDRIKLLGNCSFDCLFLDFYRIIANTLIAESLEPSYRYTVVFRDGPQVRFYDDYYSMLGYWLFYQGGVGATLNTGLCQVSPGIANSGNREECFRYQCTPNNWATMFKNFLDELKINECK